MVLWLDQAALCSHKMSESATAGDEGHGRGTLDTGFTDEPVGLWENASVDLFLDEVGEDPPAAEALLLVDDNRVPLHSDIVLKLRFSPQKVLKKSI